jgi:hypothetical protein
MSDLVRQFQRAVLGSGGWEELHAVLVALRIPAGRPPQPDAFERVRRAALYAGTSEDELRSALGDLGLTGGGADPAGGLRAIRKAILHNL